MTILPIRTLGDPVLRQETSPVERFDEALRRMVDDMLATMYDAPGVGLAAPQVGVSSRFFVYDDGETGPSFLANPEIVMTRKKQMNDEGCLSIPGPFYPMERAMRVRVRGQGLDGDRVELTGEGLLARIFQHETDHLSGRLFIDHLDEPGRREVMRLLREHEMRRATEGR